MLEDRMKRGIALYKAGAAPKILVSGDHGRIAEFRRRMSERLTRERRPDLWEKFLINDKNKVVGYGSWFLYNDTTNDYIEKFYSKYYLSEFFQNQETVL